MRRITQLLPKSEMGNLEIPLCWPLLWRWVCRCPWWVVVLVMIAWAPVGLLLHFPFMAMWWEEERKRERH